MKSLCKRSPFVGKVLAFILFAVLLSVPLTDGSRTFVADVRWATEKHASLQAKSTLLTRRRGNARSAWNRLQAREEDGRVLSTADVY